MVGVKLFVILIFSFLGEELQQQSTLQLVQIYFDTATFDNIERDKKIKTEAQLSLIGGTMGLLTGFSIISGVEIIFFLLRSFFVRFKCANPFLRSNILFCRLIFKLGVGTAINLWMKLDERFKTIKRRLMA